MIGLGLHLAYERHVNIKENFTCRKYKNPILDRYYKDYCRILSKVIKEAKKMQYDKRILNSTNRMKTSWNLINTERGKGMNNQITQPLHIGDEITTDHQMPLINTL